MLKDSLIDFEGIKNLIFLLQQSVKNRETESPTFSKTTLKLKNISYENP